MGREIHENILRNQIYFDFAREIRKAGIQVKDSDFTPFIESIYNNEVKEIIEEYYSHNLKQTHKVKVLEETIRIKCNHFIQEHEGRK